MSLIETFSCYRGVGKESFEYGRFRFWDICNEGRDNYGISLTLLLSLYTTTLNSVDVTKTSRVMVSNNCSLHYSSPLCFPLSGTSLRR